MIAGNSNSQGSSSARVARNTLWYGAENITGLITAGLMSILVARSFGPAKLGHFSFIVWVTTVCSLIGSFALPMTTRKYMAEYFGRGDRGTARAIFFAMLRAQTLLAFCVGGLGILASFIMFEPAYRLVAAILFASLIPHMIANAPSMANSASERFASNVPGSVAGMLVHLAGILLTLSLGWNLPGLAFSLLLSRTIEAIIKMISALRWLGELPKAAELPAQLRSRMVRFATGGFAFIVLNYLVWERSDVLLLKLLQTDVRQIAFFSVPFSLGEAALMVPRTLGSALGASSLLHYGRDRQDSFRITELSFKYTLICGVPLLAGLAALSTPLTLLLYGEAYRPAAHVLAVMALLAIAKCVLGPVQTLYFATERLGLVVWVTSLSGVVNVLLDYILIPRYGALGAGIGNGVAQALAAILLWGQAIRIYNLKLRREWFSAIALCTGAMATVALCAVMFLHHWIGIPAAIAAGALTFLLTFRGSSLITSEERLRLLHLASATRLTRHLAVWLTKFVTPAEPATSSPEALREPGY